MRKLIPVFVLSFFLYLLVSYLSISIPNFDTHSYIQIGTLTLKGINIYPDPAISRHPYLPFFLYLEAGSLFLSQLIHIPQILILKGIFMLFHLSSISIVFLLSKKNPKVAWMYAFNPVSLLIIAFHGQFDIIPLFLILLSLLLLKQKKYISIMLALGVAFTIKTWPVLFLIPFLKRIPKKYWAWFILPPVLAIISYIFLFHVSLFSVVRVFAVYQGVGGVWGFGKIISLITTNKIVLFISKVLFVFGIILYSVKMKNKPVVEELFEILFFFFIFTPGFGIQWFLWLIPFFFLTKKPYIYVFMAAITICLCVTYLTWLPQSPINIQMAYSTLLLLWPVFCIYYTLFFLIKNA